MTIALYCLPAVLFSNVCLLILPHAVTPLCLSDISAFIVGNSITNKELVNSKSWCYL